MELHIIVDKVEVLLYVNIILHVNKKNCELNGGNIGIVEKAQETRFGMSTKYSRYIGIAC